MRKSAHNVLIILVDDLGFGAISPFGGPVPTPTLDQLAKGGLRYNNFHTTSLYSPTRRSNGPSRSPAISAAPATAWRFTGKIHEIVVEAE